MNYPSGKLRTCGLRIREKGFTFIELILYVAIVTIILSAIVPFAWSAVETGVKSAVQQEVNANARYISERIKYEIRNSTGINSVTATSISLSTPTTLMGYWNLDETSGTIAADSSGNGNNGTLINTTWTVGKYNNGVLFDSASDYIDLPDTTANFSGAFTVELWAKWNSLSGIQALAGKVQDSANIAFVLFKNTDNKIYLNTKLADAQSGSLANPTVVTTGIWYHIAAVMDASNNVILYVNAANPTTTAMGNRNNLGDLRIGNTPDAFWGDINGTIDDVRIYNTALTQAEITTDMNNNAAPTVIDLSAGNIRIKQGATSAVNLNSANTVINSLTFTNYTSLDNKTKHIQFVITVAASFAAARQEYQDSVVLEGSSEVRSN